MNSRQRILAALNGYEMDRIPIIEIGIWPETEKRWRAEGLPKGISPHDYLGIDKISLFSFDSTFGIEEKTLEETAEFKIFLDSNGITRKTWKMKQGAPLFIDSSVKNKDDWSKLSKRLSVDFSRFKNQRTDIVWGNQLECSQLESYKKSEIENTFKVLVPIEPWWYFYSILGDEEALITMALEPDFAELIMSDFNKFSINMIKEILSKDYRFDALWVFSDMCYKNGLLFSPNFYIDRIVKYQKELFEIAKENNMKVIYHSDGNITDLIPLIKLAGIDCIQPMEARAGNDICDIINVHGNSLSYIGNINADILSTTEEEIFSEIARKVKYAMKSKRYLFHSDHSIPDMVSFDNYKYAIALAKQIGAY